MESQHFAGARWQQYPAKNVFFFQGWSSINNQAGFCNLVIPAALLFMLLACFSQGSSPCSVPPFPLQCRAPQCGLIMTRARLPDTPNAAPDSGRASAVQAIDSRECLDTVGPLPGENSRPVSAAGMLMGAAGSSPGKLVATAGSCGDVAVVPGVAVVQASPLKDGDTVEVVIHEPPPLDSRWDAARRNSGDASTAAFAMHPLIQVRPSWDPA